MAEDVLERVKRQLKGMIAEAQELREQRLVDALVEKLAPRIAAMAVEILGKERDHE